MVQQLWKYFATKVQQKSCTHKSSSVVTSRHQSSRSFWTMWFTDISYINFPHWHHGMCMYYRKYIKSLPHSKTLCMLWTSFYIVYFFVSSPDVMIRAQQYFLPKVELFSQVNYRHDNWLLVTDILQYPCWNVYVHDLVIFHNLSSCL